jgi:predicted MFS family arabinose efflux permease
VVFATACGLAVANVYSQPLLDAMAADFHISPASIGAVVTATQSGYALGLLFIVPLGDLVDRRKVIVGQSILSALALIVVATAPTGAVLLAGMVAVGLLAVVVQALVAFAATLSAPSARGRTVGMVTSGVVIGILLARFVAGVLADLGGWRSVYATSAALTLCMAAVLNRVLPSSGEGKAATSYAGLLRSIPAVFLEEPFLRIRAVLALLIFATFSSFWTSLVLPLSAPPLVLSHTQIGLFGLAGMAGALAASGAERLVDRGVGQRTTGVSLSLMLVAWAPIAMLHTSMTGPGVRRRSARPRNSGRPRHQSKHDLRRAP